ncbi:hypothetical protein V500_04224 [Pseudogymnoascus sp. VKM F-4518 (FW-2643)]|nr:hypothetical protein V500_04224 [Pseudogymnoascus sp. VKM F-4518 (FW-2643)]
MPLDFDHQEVQDAPIENGDEAGYPGDYSDDANGRFVIINNADEGQHGDDGQTRTLRSLHPYTRPLTVSDLDSCIALENAAFDENERCSPDKFKYRLSKCGELSLGLFCTATPDSDIPAATLKTGKPVETSRANGAVSVLLAHVVATKTRDGLATDVAMDYPKNWESAKKDESKEGHHEDGRTICVHSLAVLPEFQGSGIGRTIMMAYMQQMNGAGIADRLAIIAHGPLVSYYEKLGFVNKGPSEAQFGGGGWFDMIFDLKSIEARAMYG